MLDIMGTPYPLRPGEADCRDYLRTGRCKYGESCKYNHPTNVESGGGVKPLNPSEPLFPIRPTEPPCQYFLKHGTCKFGQSCKFNHPSVSHTATSDGVANSLPTGLVFLTSNGTGFSIDPNALRRHGDSFGGDGTVYRDGMPSHVVAAPTVQILPQRPTEPNCIYFLRNGRCKYGATCKFHHPIDVVNADRGRNQTQHLQSNHARPSYARDRSHSLGSSSDGRNHVHSATYTNLPSNVSYGQSPRLQPITERVRPQQPTHILLPDGQIAVILDPQSLQNINDMSIQENNRPKFYVSQSDGTLASMDQSSVTVSPMLTATSASTSAETFASHNIDLWGVSPGQGTGTQFRSQVNGAPTNDSGPASRHSDSNSYMRTMNDFDQRSSGGSLSAYGSIDPENQVQASSNQHLSQSYQVSLPQPKSWSGDTGESESYYQPPVKRTPSNVEMYDGQSNDGYRHRTVSMGSTTDRSSTYYWPSNGSLSTARHEGNDLSLEDPRSIQGYESTPSPSLNYRNVGNISSGRAFNNPQSIDRESGISPSFSSERMSHNSLPQQGGGTRGSVQSRGDDDGLTMMTSALLTMMDRPEDESENMTQRTSHQRPYPSTKTDRKYYQNETNMQGRPSPTRPPPGMTNAPRVGTSGPHCSSHISEETLASSPPPEGNYVVGGYSKTTSWSPSWGDS